MKDNEDIEFEEVGGKKAQPHPLPSFGNMQGNNGTHVGVSNRTKSPILGCYKSLYAELKSKCDPKNFMEPYDQQKVSIANELYSCIIALKGNASQKVLKDIRSQAMQKLGIKFSTEALYGKLEKICNPKNFTGDNYNKDYVALANSLYPKVLQCPDDILELEKINKLAKPLKEDLKKRENQAREDFILIAMMLIFIFIVFILVVLGLRSR